MASRRERKPQTFAQAVPVLRVVRGEQTHSDDSGSCAPQATPRLLAFLRLPSGTRALTSDMSGARRLAKPAGGRPLDGEVRRQRGCSTRDDSGQQVTNEVQHCYQSMFTERQEHIDSPLCTLLPQRWQMPGCRVTCKTRTLDSRVPRPNVLSAMRIPRMESRRTVAANSAF